MDGDPSEESVDDTLQTSVLQVKSSRELMARIDKRLERGAELLQDSEPVIDFRQSAPETD